MTIKVLWNSHDSARVIGDLPLQGLLPCRTVLVPGDAVSHVLRKELIQAGSKALCGTRFVPAPAAAIEVLRSAGINFRLGEEELRPARVFALFRADLELRYFSLQMLRSLEGWDESFSRTISDLESAGLCPQDLETPIPHARILDVCAIWRELNESAGSSWTVQQIYNEAALALERDTSSWPFRGPILAIATGATTAAEAHFFSGIPGATIGFLAARPVRSQYLARMGRLFGDGAGDVLRTANAPRAGKTECQILGSYFFEAPAILANQTRSRSDGPDGTVELEEHSGVDAEIEATADWVARQIAGGTPLEEIAILVPSPDPLLIVLAERLRRLPWHDGPFPIHVADGLPLTSFAAGARAMAVVRALRAYLSAEWLLSVLPMLRATRGENSHLSSGEAMELVWSLGTAGGSPARPAGALEWSSCAAAWETELSDQLASGEEIEGCSPNQRVLLHDRHMEPRLANLRAIRPALDELVAVEEMSLNNAGLKIIWNRLFSFMSQWLLEPGEGARPHILLNEYLAGMLDDATCGSLTGDDALRFIEKAVSSIRVPVGKFGDPCVYAGTLHRAVGLSFEAVRVIGLSEGHLPSAPTEDPVLPDSMREQLQKSRANHMPVAVPTAADHVLNELHALDIVIRDARSHVALSAARLDVDRSEREPSSVVLEAAAALARPNSLTGEPAAAIPDRIALRRDGFAPARARATEFRLHSPLGEVAWQDAVSEGALKPPPSWRQLVSLDLARIESIIENTPLTQHGLLGAGMAALKVPGLSADYPISPSTLSTLLNCPHQFLLERLLGFSELPSPPPQQEIGQPYYGTLLHAVAGEFYRVNGKEFCAHKRTIGEWLDCADGVLDQAFSEFLKQYPLIGELVRAQQRARLRRDFREFLQYDWEKAPSMHFVAVERNFGAPEGIELRLDGCALFVRGRIDRIDVQNGTLLIRDIKTGSAHPRLGKEASPDAGRDLQIALYGMIAQTLAAQWRVVERVGVAYTYVSRGGAVERQFRDEFREVLEPKARSWLGVARRLLALRLFPRTPNDRDCVFCCFRPVCGEQANQRAAEVLISNQELLGDFTALKNLGGEGD
jgi:RecB family exonuclease